MTRTQIAALRPLRGNDVTVSLADGSCISSATLVSTGGSRAATLWLLSGDDDLFVNIDQEGRFFVDGRFRLEEELEHVMRQAAANNPLTQTVVIRADRQADWQSVASAINVCKKVGIANYTAMMADE